jgi:CXXC-20-CXXC protein
MSLLSRCPNCKEKTFTVFNKAKLLGDGALNCSECGEKTVVPSLMRLFVSILMATLLPSFVLIFWGIVGFTYSLIITLILMVIIFFLLAYISPMKLKTNNS